MAVIKKLNAKNRNRNKSKKTKGNVKSGKTKGNKAKDKNVFHKENIAFKKGYLQICNSMKIPHLQSITKEIERCQQEDLPLTHLIAQPNAADRKVRGQLRNVDNFKGGTRFAALNPTPKVSEISIAKNKNSSNQLQTVLSMGTLPTTSAFIASLLSVKLDQMPRVVNKPARYSRTVDPTAKQRQQMEVPTTIDGYHLLPLFSNIYKLHFSRLQKISIYSLPISYQEIEKLAFLFQIRFAPISHLILMDCLLTSNKYFLKLMQSLCVCDMLTSINLDHNTLGDEGCTQLCNGLMDNRAVQQLSLCHCGITSKSGELLGKLILSTSICDLYLDSNRLGCSGTTGILKQYLSVIEFSDNGANEKESLKNKAMSSLGVSPKKGLSNSTSISTTIDPKKESNNNSISAKRSILDAKSRKSTTSVARKKSSKSSKSSRKKTNITLLSLRDNEVCWNRLSQLKQLRWSDDNEEFFKFLTTIKRFVQEFAAIKGIDLRDNDIGDVGATHILSALKARKAAKIKAVKIKVTHRINEDLYDGIVKFGTYKTKTNKKTKKDKGIRSIRGNDRKKK